MPHKDPIKKREYAREWTKRNRVLLNERGRTWRLANPHKTRKYSRRVLLRSKYNLTQEQYDQMREAQKGMCALCGKPPKDKRGLFVDHNHRTGKVRGLLCTACNFAVGVYETRGVIGVWAYLSKYDSGGR